jgi:hypothetical protein
MTVGTFRPGPSASPDARELFQSLFPDRLAFIQIEKETATAAESAPGE